MGHKLLKFADTADDSFYKVLHGFIRFSRLQFKDNNGACENTVVEESIHSMYKFINYNMPKSVHRHSKSRLY